MRKLATIQTISEIVPIEGADFIEIVKFAGTSWQCVAKKGEFQMGDRCVYFEVDSLLPDVPAFEFLKKSSFNPRVGKNRLRTTRFKGALSQGLALPISTCAVAFDKRLNFFQDYIYDGDDLTEILGIEKYEPPIPAEIAGDVEGPYPHFITKTDEERIQNIPEIIEEMKKRGNCYSTVKLDGTSCTMALVDGKFSVGSRNWFLKENASNTFWRIAREHDIENKLKKFNFNIVIQGEVVGEGIQGNKLGLVGQHFYLFNAKIVKDGKEEKMDLNQLVSLAEILGLKTVPILDEWPTFPFNTVEEILAYAEGEYKQFFPQSKWTREGVVFRTCDQNISFKAISNKFLLKGGDE